MTYESFVHSRIKWLPTLEENLHHATTGIMGEVIELEFAGNADEQFEELGDICFYIEHFQQAFKNHRRYSALDGETTFYSSAEALSRLRYHAGQLLDTTKKLWIYNKPVDDSVIQTLNYNLNRIEGALHTFCEFSSLPLENAKIANQEKLLKRYPQGYSDQAAQERADKS
jgi:hypothetical protein